MSRRVRYAFTASLAVLLSLSLVSSASAATVIDILDARLMEQGGAVQVTVGVTCDPLPADGVAFFATVLWQGVYPRPRYLEGFGGFGEFGGVSLACDGEPHTISVTVRPSVFYADKRFRPGRTMSESLVQVCLSTLCSPGELIREKFSIHGGRRGHRSIA